MKFQVPLYAVTFFFVFPAEQLQEFEAGFCSMEWVM
jgi:hypothetical protein